MTGFILVEQHTQVLDLDELFGETILECPNCGHEFTIDTETAENMTWLVGAWIPQCPNCGHVQQ